MTPVAKRRRSGGPPLRYDWQRRTYPGDPHPVYRARPSENFYLFAWLDGGSWRWGIGIDRSLVYMLRNAIYLGTHLPTLIRAKHAAENWYREHGGKDQPTIWETIIEPSEVPDDAIR